MKKLHQKQKNSKGKLLTKEKQLAVKRHALELQLLLVIKTSLAIKALPLLNSFQFTSVLSISGLVTIQFNLDKRLNYECVDIVVLYLEHCFYFLLDSPGDEILPPLHMSYEGFELESYFHTFATMLTILPRW